MVLYIRRICPNQASHGFKQGIGFCGLEVMRAQSGLRSVQYAFVESVGRQPDPEGAAMLRGVARSRAARDRRPNMKEI